jgi:hypothetical protein
MELVTGKIGSKNKADIETILKDAKELIIATCYLKPNSTVKEYLKKIPKLKLIYSQEYQITDPESIWELFSNGAEVRYVPVNDSNGRLHAKVYYCILKNGSRFAFVGSANLTYEGLFKNQEVGVLFGAQNRRELATIKKISEWLTNLWKKYEGNVFDESEYKRAKRQHNIAKRLLTSSKIHPWKQNTKSKWGKDWHKIRYWVLKTKDGSSGDDFWNWFLEEKVIAIGWAIDSGRARMFRKFNIGDIVVVCNGYRPNTRDNTHILIKGVARVLGKAFKDKNSKWWKNGGKRLANIQVIDKAIEKGLIVEYLNRGSLSMATHEIDRPDYFEELAISLYEEFGIKIDV